MIRFKLPASKVCLNEELSFVLEHYFFISLVELDEFIKIKLSKISRLDQGLNQGGLHNSQAC